MNDQPDAIDPNAPIAEIPIAPLTEQVSQASGEGGGLVAPGAAAELMTRDEFFDFFSHAFTVSGGIVGMMQPPPLDSLMRAGELPTARPCADAIYDAASKFPWLQFLIRKEGAWIAALAAVGAFGLQLTANVRAELAARAEAAKPQPEAAAA